MMLVENSGRGTLNLRFKVSLKPGINEVDSEAWEQCKDDGITKHYLGARQVRVVSGDASKSASKPKASTPAPVAQPEPEPDVPEPEPEAEPEHPVLCDMSAKDAIAYAKVCDDYDFLEQSLEEGVERPTVAWAIEKRLIELDEE